MNGYDLIIPVYNEKKIIKLLDYLFISSNLITKIYICYDNDKDITVQFIKNSKYFNFSKVILLKNLAMGPCEAVKTGIYKSNSSAIIVYPADDFNNGTLLDQMYQEFKNGYDIVCPSRFMSGGVIKNCPLLKYLIVRTVSFFLYHLSNIKVKDPTNGFRLFSRRLINKIPIESKLGFAYSIELLVKAEKNNFKIKELPSIWIERDDRKSNFKIFKWARQYLKWFFFGIF
tara:strand:- start:166 stop:852 length:687 start_codon:yes stop_codon:yes gene_type:complete